jgi:hypothetical protein
MRLSFTLCCYYHLGATPNPNLMKILTKTSALLDTDVGISENVYYTAQEWVYGSRYCSYSVVRDGRLRALAIYPVKDTLDDSSCVYFESTEHPGSFHRIT